MGFKNLKYGDGRWFFVRAIMDEHLHKLLDRSFFIKEWKQTDYIGDVRPVAPRLRMISQSPATEVVQQYPFGVVDTPDALHHQEPCRLIIATIASI